MQNYYNVIDTDRSSLGTLYAENSMLTFEGDQMAGDKNIIQKYGALGKMKHEC